MAAGAVAVAVASAPTELPRRLWELHRATAVGEVVSVDLRSVVDPQRRADLITGGGFEPTGRPTGMATGVPVGMPAEILERSAEAGAGGSGRYE